MEKIYVLIPTYNAVDDLQATMNSVQNQNYPKKDIYIIIVDFGSNDGTYEKALSYCDDHVGIYQKGKLENKRQRIVEIARILVYLDVESACSVILYPGDVIYPNCFQTCKEMFEKYKGYQPNVVVAEVDINEKCQGKMHQTPLFSATRLLNVQENISDFFHQYQHQIICVFKGIPFGGRHKANSDGNEQRWWNKMPWLHRGKYIIYVKDVLGCEQAVEYENEFDEIVYRWDGVLLLHRVSSEVSDGSMSIQKEYLEKHFQDEAFSNLAEYALWRSFYMYKKRRGKLEVENCYLIAEVIYPKIKESRVHQMLKKLIEESDQSVTSDLEEYFALGRFKGNEWGCGGSVAANE